jgi:hypothetical protein
MTTAGKESKGWLKKSLLRLSSHGDGRMGDSAQGKIGGSRNWPPRSQLGLLAFCPDLCNPTLSDLKSDFISNSCGSTVFRCFVDPLRNLGQWTASVAE